MAGNFSQNSHWRDTARPARFFLIDYRAALPLLLFLLHIRWWTFFLTVGVTLFLAVLERYGFTVSVFIRWFRSTLAGPRRYARPWWRQ